MTSVYHPGELAVQARAGVQRTAARLSGIVQTELHPQAQWFVAEERFAIVAITDVDRRVWASFLGGEAGVVRVRDQHTLVIEAAPPADDPLAETLAAAGERGVPVASAVLVIDLTTRRRLRLNGSAERTDGGGVLLHVKQSYWNCPKYIQRRVIVAAAGDAAASVPAVHAASVRATGLTDSQRRWIAGADTFFIASAHPSAGADASHRGGEPGFVRLARDGAGDDVITFPDYSGNDMFNTLGNLQVNPAAGLLFVDFERGATLQLTGRAEILWERDAYASWPGAERAVRFVVARAIERQDATALRWRLVERSPFNPPATGDSATRSSGS